jgi:hypothetical protein
VVVKPELQVVAPHCGGLQPGARPLEYENAPRDAMTHEELCVIESLAIAVISNKHLINTLSRRKRRQDCREPHY